MEQKLRQMIKESMIAKNKTFETECRYATLKNILDAAQKSAKEKQVAVTDSMIIDAAKKEIKQANDLLSYCKDNDAKASEVRFSISVAQELLPDMISKEQIEAFVISYQGDRNIGNIMKELKAKYGDALDCKLASQVIKANI